MSRPATAQQFDPQERKQYLGASEIGAIMGVDRYRTALDVYNEKLGLVEPFAGNNHTERGNRLEHIAAELYTEINGAKLRRKNQAFVHPVYPFIVGHVDRVFEGQKKIAEIKAPSVAAYRKYQREGLPAGYAVQMNTYLGLSGYTEGEFIIFSADQFDLISFAVKFEQELYDFSIAKAADFWQSNILTRTPPDLASDEKPKYEIAAIGGDITVRDDETFIQKAEALREAEQLKADAEELLELAKKDILGCIEFTPGSYKGGCLTLHYKEQAGRTTFDKKSLAAAHPEIDLSRFEKQGKPFFAMRTYFSK